MSQYSDTLISKKRKKKAQTGLEQAVLALQFLLPLFGAFSESNTKQNFLQCGVTNIREEQSERRSQY